MGKQTKDKNKKMKNGLSPTTIDSETLKDLGGEKVDLELLEGVEDGDDEAVDYEEDLEAEPIKRDEVRDFIKGLGIPDIMQYIEEDIDSGAESPDLVPKREPDDVADEERTSSEAGGTKKDKKNRNKYKDLADKDSPSKRTPEKKKNKYKPAEVQDGEVSSTSGGLDVHFIAEYMPRKHSIVKPGTKWHEYGFKDDPSPSSSPPGDKVEELLNYAAKLHEDETATYKQQRENSKKSDVTWMRTVLSSGTLHDKMAAWTLLVQEAPVHNLTTLDHLITMAAKKGRREALMAVDTLKELFLSELLPDDAKLKTFDQHPLSLVEELASGNRDTRDKRLILWYYEDALQKKYAEFVQALETLCHDNLREVKLKTIGVVFALLAGKSEQEKKLLTILTNKLGDPDYKVASNSAHQLTNLVQRHPNMKQVIVAEVERLMYRPNVAQKAQYYAVCFLNQVLLSKRESDLALRLINIYFSFFKAFVSKGEVDGKMLSALLTGVNRAYPYAKEQQTKVSEQMDMLYKVVHIVNFNTSVQALMLLYQVLDTSENSADRYYQALYRKLIDPDLVTSSKQSLFLNLVYKSLRKDTVDRRIKAFIKRLLQICCSQPPSFICGSLVLLSEILKAKPSVFQFNQMSQDSDDDEDEHFEDVLDDDDLSAEAKQHKDTQNALHTGYTTVSSWVHRKNLSGVSKVENYDPHHRNPLYCRADTECVWELDKLTNHYHPTVSLFAKNILSGEGISYSGDPLDDFTLIRFLDRFVYRNPKKKEKEKEGTKIYEHLQAKSRHQVAVGVRGLAVNTEQFMQTDIADIPVEERFFHKYFLNQAAKKAEKEEAAGEGSEVDDDEFDTFLDDYEKGLDGADFKLDFAGEFSKTKVKKSKRKGSDDEDDGEDDDDMDDLSDEEVAFDNDLRAAFDDSGDDIDIEGGFEEAFDEDLSGEDELNEEAVSFSDDDEFGMDVLPSTGDKRARKSSNTDPDDVFLDGAPPSRKKKKKAEFDPATLFAAAEEFADIIDDNASSKVSAIGSEALSNKDNAHAKQLKWEQNRDQWLKGQDWKTRKRGKPGSQRGSREAQKHGGKHGHQQSAFGKKGKAVAKKGGKFGNKPVVKHGQKGGRQKGGKKGRK